MKMDWEIFKNLQLKPLYYLVPKVISHVGLGWTETHCLLQLAILCHMPKKLIYFVKYAPFFFLVFPTDYWIPIRISFTPHSKAPSALLMCLNHLILFCLSLAKRFSTLCISFTSVLHLPSCHFTLVMYLNILW